MNKVRTICVGEVMADRLNGYRILILETREEAQFSRLLTEQGADVLQCPMFTINDAPDPAPIEAWIRGFVDQPFDDLVLMTGEGQRRLMKVVRRIRLGRPPWYPKNSRLTACAPTSHRPMTPIS